MKQLITLSELRKLYLREAQKMPRSIRLALSSDNRIGARELLEQINRREFKQENELRRLNDLSKYEQIYWKEGYELIAGVDEVGCAPLAGPVLAAAVILPPQCIIQKVDDSKKLSAALRERLACEIKAKSIAWGVGMASPEEISELNIYHADLLAMQRALLSLKKKPNFLLIDGRSLSNVDIPQLKIIGGDQKSISIASASIIAKVTRDALMSDYDKLYPGYAFSKNKGYATLEHIDALGRLGATPIHRNSWNAVKEYSRFKKA